MNNIYQCAVNNNPAIAIQDSAIISSLKGTHEGSKTNNDVFGFRGVQKSFQFFPLGLEKYFPNIKLIHFESCPLKQLRQFDLMDYKNLRYLCIFGSDLSIIEARTFDYNPNLQFLNLGNNKFLSIDPNAFKSLAKLTNLYLHSVPCIDRYTRDKNGIESILKDLETKCKNPGFLSLNEKFNNLESQSKIDDFEENLKIFEVEFRSSEFFNNPSLKTRLETLKISNQSSFTVQSSTKVPQKQESCEYCCQNISIDNKAASFDESLGTLNIGNFQNLLEEYKLLLNGHDTKLTNIQASQEVLKSSQCNTADIITKINDFHANIKSTLIKTEAELKSSFQTDLKTFQNLFKSSQESIKSSQDETINDLSTIKTEISDVEALLSKIKSSQTDLQSSINKLRLTQNEFGIAIDKIVNNEDFDGKIEKVEIHLMDFEVKTNEKLEEIKKDLANSRHKMTVNLDEKLKSIEIRLIKKFENLLEEKLGKILDDKLGSLIEARSSSS